MKVNRKDFTETQKAEILVRDRATCAFSVESLWILDHGVKSNWLGDWADHIVPCALGGSAELENGICASNFYNLKKGANVLHNIYYIKNGEFTEHFTKAFGHPNQGLINQLDRLKNLQPADWFFNRSIMHIFDGYDCRCDKEFKGLEWKRDDNYWFRSALKKLYKFHKKKTTKSIEERGLLKNPMPFGSLELLKLETINTERELRNWIEDNYQAYRQSYKAFYEYFVTVPKSERNNYINKIEKIPNLHPSVIAAIKEHFNNPSNTSLSTEVLLGKVKAERYMKRIARTA